MAEAITATDPRQLQQVIALNTELVALTKAGLPLEPGLSAAALDGLGQRVADRLRAGVPLEQALEDEEQAIPPAYRAVILAGLKSGRLDSAVGTVNRAAETLLSVRNRIRIAAIYPTILLLLALVILLAMVPAAIYAITHTLDFLRLDLPPWLDTLRWLFVGNPGWWKIWVPLLLIAVLWGLGGLTGLGMRMPGIRSAVRLFRVGTFAELAASLLEAGIPLHEALRLAADGSGDAGLQADVRAAVPRLQEGAAAAEVMGGIRSLPPFARWLLSAGASQGTLAASFRQVASWSDRKATARADWFRLTAPTALVLITGGLAVTVSAVLLFTPLFELFSQLAKDVVRP